MTSTPLSVAVTAVTSVSCERPPHPVRLTAAARTQPTATTHRMLTVLSGADNSPAHARLTSWCAAAAGEPKSVRVVTGSAADTLVRATNGDSHAPDLIGIAQHGVVYTGGVSKIAEHGGDAPDDRDVALVVSGAGVDHHKASNRPAQTTQIAPSILALLGLNPRSLDAVQTDHTATLPSL